MIVLMSLVTSRCIVGAFFIYFICFVVLHMIFVALYFHFFPRQASLNDTTEFVASLRYWCLVIAGAICCMLLTMSGTIYWQTTGENYRGKMRQSEAEPTGSLDPLIDHLEKKDSVVATIASSPRDLAATI